MLGSIYGKEDHLFEQKTSQLAKESLKEHQRGKSHAAIPLRPQSRQKKTQIVEVPRVVTRESAALTNHAAKLSVFASDTTDAQP